MRTYYPISLSLLVILSLLAVKTRGDLREFALSGPGTAESPLYLPKASQVRLLTLGFNNLAADIGWFHTVNYFGKELQHTRDYRWLYEMCDLITSLDPKAEHYYEFCSTLLSWIAKNPEESNTILTKGIKANPELWRPRYLRGFNYWYFLEQNDLARQDLQAASLLPNAPTFLASLASRMMVQKNELENAIAFLKDLIQTSKSDSAKRALSDKLKRAYISKNQRTLTHAVAVYRERFGRSPASIGALVADGILQQIPDDGFGGTFVYDPETAEVRNTSGERGLEFKGMTAKTGAFKALEGRSQ